MLLEKDENTTKQMGFQSDTVCYLCQATSDVIGGRPETSKQLRQRRPIAACLC